MFSIQIDRGDPKTRNRQGVISRNYNNTRQRTKGKLKQCPGNDKQVRV